MTFIARHMLLTCLAAIMLPAMVFAQAFDPIAMISALESEKTGPTVRALKEQNALNIDYYRPLPAAFDFASVDLNVAFDGNTHILTATGMKTLRTMAVAMKDRRLDGLTFQVAGHVFIENNGTIQHRLSTQRAQAVVEHLVVFYGIARERLIPVGYGAIKPKNAAAPFSPENTRIEFINLTGA